MVEHILSYLKEKKKHAYVTLVVVGVVYMTMSDTPTPTMLVTWTQAWVVRFGRGTTVGVYRGSIKKKYRTVVTR